MGVTASIQKYPVAPTANFTATQTNFITNSVAISNVTWNAAYIEYTTATAHGFQVGQYVEIAGVRLSAASGSPGVNGLREVTAVPTTTTFRIAVSGTALTYVAGTGAVTLAMQGGVVWIKYVNNLWFVATNYDGLWYSADGITWTLTYARGALSSTAGYIIQDITFGNGVYVVTSDVINGVATSTDLVTWTARSVATGGVGTWATEWISALSLFVITTQGANTQIWTSPDGITWTSRFTGGSAGKANYVGFDGTYYTISSQYELLYSTNLTSWTTNTMGSTYRGVTFWDTISNRYIFKPSNTVGYADPDVTRAFSNNVNNRPAFNEGTQVGGQTSTALGADVRPNTWFQFRGGSLFVANFYSDSGNGYYLVNKATIADRAQTTANGSGMSAYYPSTTYRIPVQQGAYSNITPVFAVNNDGTKALVAFNNSSNLSCTTQYIIASLT